MNVKAPKFQLTVVPSGGFDGEELKHEPLTLTEARQAIAEGSTVTFGCTFTRCTESLPAEKMKNLDRNRVPFGALAPICPNHGQAMEREYGIALFPMGLSLRRAIEAYDEKQRLALMGRLLNPATDSIRTRPPGPRLALANRLGGNGAGQ